MLNRSAQESEDSSVPPEMSLSTSSPSSEASRRPVRSEFARLGPVFAVRRAATVAIALAVLGGALYVALGLGGHRQPQEVPVIKAEGDYKQKPEEPGGIDIPHQDMQVYQKLDQQGAEPSQAEHLLPEAETPQPQLMPSGGPSFSDNAAIEAAHLPPTSAEASVPQANSADSSGASPVIPASGLPGAAESAPAGAVASPEPAVAPPSMPVATASSSVSSSGSGASAVVTQLAGASASSAPSSPAGAASGTAAAKTVSVAAAPAHVPSPPAVAPAPSAPVAQQQPVAAVPAPTVQPKIQAQVRSSAAPTPVTSGGRNGVVQLASFPDRAVAEQMVEKMQAKYAAYLGGTKLRVVQADLGAKGVYYRIQSQQMAESKAKDICSELKNLKAGCFVVHP